VGELPDAVLVDEGVNVTLGVNVTFDCGCDVPGAKGIPVSNDEFKQAIEEYWLAFPHKSPYGNVMNCWDVSSVTDMSYAFSCLPTFNERLDCWDVSNVKTMEGMFYAADAFNQPLGRWDISNVVNMDYMFSRAKAFNQDFCNWPYTAANLGSAVSTFAGTSCDSIADPKLNSPLPHAGPFCYLGTCFQDASSMEKPPGYRGAKCTTNNQCNAGNCINSKVSSGSGARICKCSKKGTCALKYRKCLLDEDCKGRTVCSKGKCTEPKPGSRGSPFSASNECAIGNCNYKGHGRICNCSKKGICVLKSGKCNETLRNADCKDGTICKKGRCTVARPPTDGIIPARCLTYGPHNHDEFDEGEWYDKLEDSEWSNGDGLDAPSEDGVQRGRWGLHCTANGSYDLFCYFQYAEGYKFKIKWRKAGTLLFGWSSYNYDTASYWSYGTAYFHITNLMCDTRYDVRVERTNYSYDTETFRTGKCPCANPCPYGGYYEGANCQIGKAPAGTTVFIYAKNYYYTSPGNGVCDYPGSWYDTANCYVMAVPSGADPFIWENHWYYKKKC
jgi:hypothetical protein